jgi:DNA-binding winged helix-turn-helix (wHTH) protein/TolB-like protein/Tfp pilus assembly protein PilF
MSAGGTEAAAPAVVRFGPFHLDRRQRLLFRSAEVVPLTPKAFELLDVLVRHAGEVVEKEALMRSVWPDTFVDEANLSHHVFALRRALGDESKDHHYIGTIPRRGYRFLAPVDAAAEAPEVAPIVRAPAAETAPPTLPARRSRLPLVITVAAVLVLAIAGAIVFARRTPAPAPRDPSMRSIAVLPFRSLVASQRDEPLEIGMTDALINRLSSIRAVVVRPTSAVRRFDAQADPLTAGRELAVDAVVEGSVQRVGDRLRVGVRLLKVADGSALWADQFDQKFTDIFELQDSISRRVASALELHLSGSEERRLLQRPTADPLAYDLYLKGRFYWSLRTPEALEKSWSYFERATNQDPRFALGWVGAADAELLLIEYAGADPAMMLPRAKEAVDKALAIDEQLAEAHATHAVIAEVLERDWSGAEASYRRALALNPNYATAHQWYGEYLMNLGRFDESIAQLDRALALDPLSQIINAVKGVALYLDGRQDEAARQLTHAIALDPAFARAHIWLGMVYDKQGKTDAARAELEEAIRLAANDSVALPALAHAYAAMGRRADAEKVAARLTEMSRTRHVNGYVMASIFVQLGDYDGAFLWLDRAWEAHDNRLSAIAVDPYFDAIRGDRRYATLLAKLRLPPRPA